MKMVRYRVTGFRSVDDSGWIDTNRVTALIGENESGKTNLLLPLWKFNPAREGDIDLVSDSPRKRFAEIRSADEKPVFVTVEFELEDGLANEIAKLTGATTDSVRRAQVARRYDGTYQVEFPDDVPSRAVPRSAVLDILRVADAAVEAADTRKTEAPAVEGLKALLVQLARDVESEGDAIADTTLESLHRKLEEARATFTLQTSEVSPRLDKAISDFADLKSTIGREPASSSDGAQDLVLEHLPTFVFYSSYGNLDSEIYLPHVINNLTRTDLGQKEAARARTLRVLFEFVGLSPQEIMDLGKETTPEAGKALSPAQISADAKKKQEREVLLQSAGTKLTREFRAWWKRGNYQFRFQADGNHFRIWVHDDLRPEDIELENRSTGLQWFLSFYLVFLVESTGAHANSVLLLDEPGLSLHPLAQRDLSAFFEGLAVTNQLIYTTHSPFLVDPDHLDRVKAVYIDEVGNTCCSPDLRASERGTGKRSSVYPVYAALGISVSDVLLLGCLVVIVEGVSDQYVLSALKNVLLGAGRIVLHKEIVFVPVSGVKSVKPITSLIAGPNEQLPYVVLDGDDAGKTMARGLREGLYAQYQDRIILLSDITGRDGDEVEDLLTPSGYADAVDRYTRNRDAEFAPVADASKPITPQVEAFAKANKIALTTPGWKVEVAKIVKERITRTGPSAMIDDARLQTVERLFKKILS